MFEGRDDKMWSDQRYHFKMINTRKVLYIKPYV